MDALLCGFKSKCNRLNNIKGRKKKKKKKKRHLKLLLLSAQYSVDVLDSTLLEQFFLSDQIVTSIAYFRPSVKSTPCHVCVNDRWFGLIEPNQTIIDEQVRHIHRWDTMYNHECGDWALREHYKWLGCKWSCWSFICPLSKRLGSMSPLKKIMRWRGSATSCCMQWQHGTELDSHRAS